MRIAVFTGSAQGTPTHRKAARDFAFELGRAGIGLVYGGGRVGLMGVIADAALEATGEVIGVMPRHLVKCRDCPPGTDPSRGGRRYA